ncbi:MAG: cobalamin biosynthesis protein CbiD [Lachnospiraceae bacterium]|nr:cobalamin biosynthesis protein CbiD [Lachnospiraceae bacterium]
MKNGFTTGSCAAAAAKAATYMLLGGNRKEIFKIDTPSGVSFDAHIEDIKISEDHVSCAVRKESCDDPDVTAGILIYAKAGIVKDKKHSVIIKGGEGVGTVTRPGLDQEVGSAAINSVPRKMISENVLEIMDMFDCPDSVMIEISVPEGKEIVQKTFNPRLGIIDGISIIGTSGIIEPMSTKALIDTIRVELNQQRCEGRDTVIISPGNYGLDFMRQRYGYDLDRAVKCSNYIGDTIDIAVKLGFEKMVLVGHVGKLIKVSGGIMNTHSREADCRMELMAEAAVRSNASKETVLKILDSVSTEEAYEFLIKEGIEKQCFEHIMERVSFYLNKRAAGKMQIECMIYSNRWGLLGETKDAESLILKEVGKE